MAKTYVPIDTTAPTIRRIISRDPVAKLATAFCVLGVAAIAIYVVTRISPPPAAHQLPSSGGLQLERGPRASEPVTAAWLVVGLVCAAGLPIRITSVRRLFRRGEEVVGKVEKQYRRGRATTITYAYEFAGRGYTGTYPLTLSTTLAFNASVAVVVDPTRPSRSVLKQAYILEKVDAVPRARVIG